MGKVSDEFIDSALEKAKEYKRIIEQQQKIVKSIDRKLSSNKLNDGN